MEIVFQCSFHEPCQPPLNRMCMPRQIYQFAHQRAREKHLQTVFHRSGACFDAVSPISLSNSQSINSSRRTRTHTLHYSSCPFVAI